MTTPLNLLIIEDSEDDALLLEHELSKSGFDLVSERVDTPEAMKAALLAKKWDVVVSDYVMPRFSALNALQVLKESGCDIPFIIVSGKIGEETAVEAMKAGAADYIPKDRFDKLPMKIQRALKEVEERTARRLAEAALLQSNKEILNQNFKLQANEQMLRVQIEEYDVSQKHLQAAIIASETANYAKSQFLAIMSHELRTPMNGVLGYAQLLEMTDLTGEQRKYLATLKRSGENLTLLIRDILELSRIVDGKLMLEQTEFGLLSCIAQVVASQRPHADAKCLDFICTVSPDVPDVLVGDPLRLRQILLNLLKNAIKFTAAGRVSVTASVKERQSTTMILELTVRDTGIGIAPDKLGVIFDPFIQVDGSDTRRYGGAGLGLTLCQRLVELMGGTIHVESSVGHGTLFQLLIPFAVSHQLNPQTGQMIQSTQPSSLRSLRVLVAEDNPANAQFMMLLLTKLGHTATCVENGRDALAELESDAFDLVLMDIQMPVMNGVEALQTIRQLEQSADIPVIALTAFAMTKERERFMSEGFDGYVSKPVEINILVEEIERVMG